MELKSIGSTCAWKEVVAIFVEGNGHDPVGEIERLLYSVAMMNINVQVQHTWMIPATVAPPALYTVARLITVSLAFLSRATPV